MACWWQLTKKNREATISKRVFLALLTSPIVDRQIDSLHRALSQSRQLWKASFAARVVDFRRSLFLDYWIKIDWKKQSLETILRCDYKAKRGKNRCRTIEIYLTKSIAEAAELAIQRSTGRSNSRRQKRDNYSPMRQRRRKMSNNRMARRLFHSNPPQSCSTPWN